MEQYILPRMGETIMKTTTTQITVITLVLTEEEASILADLVQNSQTSEEPHEVTTLREELFKACKEYK